MTEARLSWKSPDHEVPITSAADLRSALDDAEADATDGPVVVALQTGGATLMHVVGDPTGSTLVYFPPDYAESGYGSMHSIGDQAAKAADESDPVQVAYLDGHHSELPRWMVVPRDLAEAALLSFMASGGELPDSIEWELD